MPDPEEVSTGSGKLLEEVGLDEAHFRARGVPGSDRGSDPAVLNIETVLGSGTAEWWQPELEPR